MWKIERITEADYGCEERQEGEKLRALVIVVDENGNKRYIEVEEEWLEINNINEKQEWLASYEEDRL